MTSAKPETIIRPMTTITLITPMIAKMAASTKSMIANSTTADPTMRGLYVRGQ
jgi:hypothetical protein